MRWWYGKFQGYFKNYKSSNCRNTLVLFLTLMCKNLKGLETCLQRGSKIQNNATVQNKLLR